MFSIGGRGLTGWPVELALRFWDVRSRIFRGIGCLGQGLFSDSQEPLFSRQEKVDQLMSSWGEKATKATGPEMLRDVE